MSIRFPPPTDSEWQAYLAKIDAAVRSERDEQRLSPRAAVLVWLASAGAVWLVVFIVSYFALQYLRGVL